MLIGGVKPEFGKMSLWSVHLCIMVQYQCLFYVFNVQESEISGEEL